MATSLDGFFADEQGNIDWLNELPPPADPSEDFGYAALLQRVDRLVMGRKTFDQVLGFGVWGYGELPITVLTHREPPPSIPSEARVSFAKGSPESLMRMFTAQGDTHIYLDGGDVVQAFLRAGFVDEFIITQVPVLLGAGMTLFTEPLPEDVWVVERVQNFPNSFNQTHIKRKGSDI